MYHVLIYRGMYKVEFQAGICHKEFFEKVKMARGTADGLINVRDWKYFKQYDFKDQEDTKLKSLLEAAEAAAAQ